MAGYFVVLGDIKDEKQKIIKSAKEILTDMCHYGTYSTNLFVKEGVQKWSKQKVATFGDYYSMNEDDYIFFFFGRKIFGVGKLVNVGDSCKYWAFPGANLPKTYDEKEISESRLTDDIKPENRCVCFFEPVQFYPHAIDMDEALTTYPDSFKALRVIQGRTFIKLDDEEALALFSVLNRRNASAKLSESKDWDPPIFDNSVHKRAKEKITRLPHAYSFTIESLLSNYQPWNGKGLQEEMAIEAAVVDLLTSHKENTVFDKLSYVTHQVSASPAKPAEYMEWMDIFGHSVSQYLTTHAAPVQFAIDKYYVMEIKRDILSLPVPKKGKETTQIRANKAVANQLMKYVDWVAKNYASGNYPMVKGVLIANGFDDNFIEYCKTMCVRNYNDGYRDSIPAVWDGFELIKYTFDGNVISFEKVFPKNNP